MDHISSRVDCAHVTAQARPPCPCCLEEGILIRSFLTIPALGCQTQPKSLGKTLRKHYYG